MKQKLTLLFLCFAMVLSLCTFLSFGTFAEDAGAAWDGSVATAYAGGSGTPEDPYQIANGAQLAYMAQQINAGTDATASFILVDDIVLNELANYENFATAAPANMWTPIGAAEATPFSGTFNGNGKTISGIYLKSGSYAGLFGVIEGATVKNLTLAKGYACTTGNKVGALASVAKNSNVSYVTNKSVYVARVSSNANSYAGGIIGDAYATDIQYCHNKATVDLKSTGGRVSSYTGGIVGYSAGKSKASGERALFLACTNEGNIYVASAHSQYQTAHAGGIAGYAIYTDIKGCMTSGSIYNQGTGSKNAGGIVGQYVLAYMYSSVSYALIDTATTFDPSIGDAVPDGATVANGGIAASCGDVSNKLYIRNCVFYGKQNTYFDHDKFKTQVGMIFGCLLGGNKTNVQYCYGMFVPYDENSENPTEIGLYAAGSNPSKIENYTVTAAHLNGTATDVINANGKFANVTSLVLAMNKYAQDKGEGTPTVKQGVNGPEFYGMYAASYLINVAPTENGTVVLEGKPAIFPDGYPELVSGYEAGQDVVVSLVPAEGYVPYKLEYTYNGETVELQKDELGKYSFVMPAGEVTLSAIFAEAGASTELKVVFLGKDGSIIEEQIVSYKGAAVAPEAPAVEGYDFIGWDIAFDEVKTDLIVNAVYQIQTYTVIFYDSLGNVLSEQAVDYGFAAVAPEAPEVEGYQFAGWDVAFDFVEEDLTVTATYNKIWTVTFLGKDGTVIGKPQIVVEGTAAEAPEAPTVEGFTFEGWDADFSCIMGDLTVNAIYALSGDLFSGGKGTANDPWQLANAADLINLRKFIANAEMADIFVSAHYILTADIDLADETYNNEIVKNNKGVITQTWIPISAFSGTLDGNSKTISNLIITNGSADQALFANASGVIKNLTMKDCEVSTSSNVTRAILVANTQGELTVQNCHIVNGKIGSGASVGLMFGYTRGTKLTVKDCTVSGSMNNSNSNAEVGGFLGFGKNVSFENCTSALTIDNRDIKYVGGFMGRCGIATSFENCISLANISISAARNRGSEVGGFVGYIDNNSGDIVVKKCTFCGTLANNENGQEAGGFVSSAPSNTTLRITDCAFYGSIYATAKAGGVVGQATDDGRQVLKFTNVLILSDISCGAEGTKGAIAAQLAVKSGSYFRNVFVAANDLYVAPTKTDIEMKYFVLSSTTTLPEGLSSDVWAVDALPAISGVRMVLGNNMSVNVLAKYGIVLKAHAAKELYVNGELASNATVTEIGGATYAMFVYDSFKVADMDKALVLSLVNANAPQKEYSITDYLTNIYGAENGKYQSLIDAMLYYGDAAQKAAYGESSVLATAGAKLEKEFAADYVATNFATANLKTHAGLSAAGIALNLYGNITPILKVDASVTEVTVSYNGKTATMATQLAVDEDGNEYAYVVYTELLATSLNNLMTVSYTLDGEEVTFDTNVAMYIETALATQDLLTEDEANLAKALAVYMRAARTFVGLD